jgi:phenylacetate-CoA ligase
MKELLYKIKWHRYHPDAFVKFSALMRNERRSIDELMACQESDRRSIVRTAMARFVFYQKFYNSVGFEVGDIGQEGWFEKLPSVTKQHLREYFEEFVDPVQRQFLKMSTTGGSTGVPTKTGYDSRIPEEIYSWRLQKRFGVNPWDDHAYIWRDTRKSKLAKFKNAAMWWPTKHLKLDASFLTDEAIEEFLYKFNKLKPALLQGYVGAVSQVAQYVLDHKMIMWSPKVVWTTSAPLPPIQRQLIQKAFGAPVCDEYGSCELRWIASQCPVGKGLHVNVEHVHIEFVDENNMPVPNGEYGRTLLTNLEDTVFPLIRYENNDRGRWLTEPCECGCTLPCIDSVKGREVESFKLPSGKTINGEFLTTIFDATPDIARGFRVVQHKDMSITVECIPSAREYKTEIETIVKDFGEKLGGEVAVKCKFVDAISHDRGKLRFVVREV